ncbi:MAG TPA: potassium channel protein [Chitinophagales bacterium]|nr:potassium channel protein [Chitinophagales bacterium]
MKIYISLAFFFIILVIGTAGFMLIENYTFVEAFYMTVITLSTVGFTEVHAMDNAGRIFTSILILANIGTFTYFLTQLSNYFLDGEFTRTYKMYKMKEAIDNLEGHVIICGFGRNGAEAARILSSNGKKFVVIEKVESRKDDLPFSVPYIIEDDATRDETLLHAGIMHASALITTLPDDADNLYVVLTARELNPHIKIISRASNNSAVRKLKTAGANNVIMPDKIGGAHMATLIISPDVKEFVDMMSTQYSDNFTITEIEAQCDISLQELDAWKRTGATVLGLKAEGTEYTLNPTPQMVIKPGMRLIVMGSKGQIEKVKALLI